MNKKYQVFLSSTFKDLENERAKVIETLLNKDCIPVGMEYFPAAGEDQMTLIKGKHPILAVFPTNKQPLYVWQHIRVVCYLQFEGSIFVSSSSVMSGNGFERISFIHSYGSMSASLQHAMKV